MSVPVKSHCFASFDGVELAWHEVDSAKTAGRTVVLLHGYLSNAATNWIRFGHAERLAAAGFRVVMPDFRAHGDSGKPHEASAYPRDVLVDDAFALIALLELTDYDLGGYSLGGRTTVRMLVRGAAPRRVVIAGMGYSGLTSTAARSAHFRSIFDNLGSFERFSPSWTVEAFLKTTRGDVDALRLILDTFVDTSPDEIAAITVPTLVLSGDEDDDNGSVDQLAAALPVATLARVPGGHMSAVTKPDLGEAIAHFLVA